jgi:acetyltransferase-like isoleucine patch superfamily enzyme
MNRFFNRVLNFFKSIWLSFIYARDSTTRFPIRASWITKIKCSKTSHLEVNGKLSLNNFDTQIGEVGQIKYDRTIIQLAENSKLIINGTVHIGPGVKIIVGKEAKVIINDSTFITSNSIILCKESITVGKKCAISWDVQIMDSDFHTLVGTPNKTTPIEIGDNVWIGSGVSILKGVKIGNGAVIGSGSIVTKSVPPKTLVAGNPARIIKENVEWNL